MVRLVRGKLGRWKVILPKFLLILGLFQGLCLHCLNSLKRIVSSILFVSRFWNANGYRVCVLAVTALKASLDVFSQTSMKDLVEKSHKLTGYMEMLINQLLPKSKVLVITPADPNQRGCQLSLMFRGDGMMEKVFMFLDDNGVTVDERKPNVIRISPTPLYNTFEDVWMAIDLIRQALD